MTPFFAGKARIGRRYRLCGPGGWAAGASKIRTQRPYGQEGRERLHQGPGRERPLASRASFSPGYLSN